MKRSVESSVNKLQFSKFAVCNDVNPEKHPFSNEVSCEEISAERIKRLDFKLCVWDALRVDESAGIWHVPDEHFMVWNTEFHYYDTCMILMVHVSIWFHKWSNFDHQK